MVLTLLASNAFLLLGDLLGIFETLQEMDFVVRVMVFSYLLFWLYQTFAPASAEILFGISAIVAGYLIFAHGITITILVLFFMFFVVFGSQMQMIIMFGLLPLLGYQHMGDRFAKVSELQGHPEGAQELAGQYYAGKGQTQAHEEDAQMYMRAAAARMR